MNKTISIFKYLIGWPLTIISFALIAKVMFSNSNILSKINSFNPLIFCLSIFVFLLYFVFRSLVWKEMLENKGHKLSLKETFFIWSSTEIKRYIPGNIWSFVSRAENYKDKGVQRKIVYSSFLLEIELIILSCSILSLEAVSYVVSNIFVQIIIYFIIFSVNILFILINGFNVSFKTENKILKAIFPKINFLLKIKLLILSLISFFLFGLATYLAGLSIIYLNPYYWEGYIGFFVFSLLAGYLSFVTPMGLGIREGFMTVSLSRFINIQSAGIFSVFSRIVFIISELIFLSGAYLWHKIKSQFILNLEDKIFKYRYQILLILLIIIYFLYFTLASFLRYDNFFTGRFDLGNMDQTVWNTINGRIFQITDPNGTNIISRLAFHADFILVLISPLYLIWANPKMLLILQSLIVSLGTLFVYFISKNITKNTKFSFSISLSYLIFPALLYANLYDFHAVTLATTFLLGTFYYFMKRKYLFFLFFAILSALTKEEIWIIISIFGFAIVIRELYENKLKVNIKKIGFGTSVFFFCLLIFYLLIWEIIPFFRGHGHFALSYYTDFGGSASGILVNIFLNPVKTITTALKFQNIKYLLDLFGPVGFLSLASPLVLIFALPDLGINLLSSNSQLHQIYYQYTSAVTPFIFISAIYGARYLKNRFKNLTLEKLSILILITSILFQYLLGPLPFTKKANIGIFYNDFYYKNQVDEYLNSIPRKYSIASTNNLGSHLSRRQNIYTIPVGIDKADVILFLLNDPFAQPSLKAQKEMVAKLQKDKNYVEIFKKEDFIVFEKKSLFNIIQPKKGQVNLFPYSITALSHRSYLKTDITVEKKIKSNGNFQSYIISYISDGLKEYALMEIPNSKKPSGGFPVMILDHGYIQPEKYSTENSYRQVADYFASNGYLVLKPDYRGNASSEILDTTFMRFAYPIDVINLIQATENIKGADMDNIHLWGHSMGGEITLKVLEIISSNENIKHKVKSAVLWAPVSDPVKWFSKTHLNSLPEATISPYPYANAFNALGTPDENPELWSSLSPLSYLPNINVPILLQHGTNDTSVPYVWSEELNNMLLNLNKNVKFISYLNDNHNLLTNWSSAVKSDLDFFNQY